MSTTVTIRKSRLCGVVCAPPSKSLSHRYLLGAALANGETVLHGIAMCDDIHATISCIRALGASVRCDGDTVSVVGNHGKRPPSLYDTVLSCHESGSTLRFLLPAALAVGNRAVFSGSPRLWERGIGVYTSVLSRMGISFTQERNTLFLNGALRTGDYEIPGNISSQYGTGFLFALPLLSGNSSLTILPPVESTPYLAITKDVLSAYGIVILESSPYHYQITGTPFRAIPEVAIEGDWSNGGALLAFRLFHPALHIGNLNPDSLQGDRCCLSLFEKLEKEAAMIDVSDIPDLAPVLFSVAAVFHGATFSGTHRLRMKESDRVGDVLAELRKFGVTATAEENRVIIEKSALCTPTVPIDCHNDHRIVMAMTLLASLCGGTLCGAEAVSKSYPHFFVDLQACGLQML